MIMLVEYLPIIIFVIAAAVLSGTLLLMGHLLNPGSPNDNKASAYECGFPAFEVARKSFDVRFYLVAILFIIFDLETAFLFPFAVLFKALPLEAIISMGIFLLLLIVGFIYEWTQGALDWD